MTTPTPPSGAPLGFFPYRIPTYNNIQPFTYKAGMTYLDKLEDLTDWLVKYLTPYIDDTIGEYVDAFNEALDKFNQGTIAFQAWVLEQKGEFQGKIDEFNALVTNANTAFNSAVQAGLAAINQRVDAATVAQTAAEAARDLAQRYAADAGDMADQTIAEFISATASATSNAFGPAARAALSDFTAPAIATIEPFTAADQFGNVYEYEIITVKAKGQNVNNVVEKTYNGYENSFSGNGNFYPPQFYVDDAARAQGAFVATNGDAVEGTTTPAARVTGIQIKNGVLLADWGSASGDNRRGVETLAFMKDGSWRTYRKETATAAQLIADGVHTTYGFGAIVVENGVLRDMENDRWGDWVTSVSARNAIGRKGNGDVIIGLVKGKTGVSGIRGNELGRMMLRHGANAAIMLDGGGSAQGYSNARYFHPSSDALGKRMGSTAILIHVPPYGSVRTGPDQLTLSAGWVNATQGGTPFVSKDDGLVTFYGNVLNEQTRQNTWYPVCTLDERYRPRVTDARGSTYGSGATAGNNGSPVLWSVSPTTGVLQVRFPGAGTDLGQGWADLSGITFRAAY